MNMFKPSSNFLLIVQRRLKIILTSYDKQNLTFVLLYYQFIKLVAKKLENAPQASYFITFPNSFDKFNKT